MAWIRKLPSGNWAATVRLPNGKKLTKTHPLKGIAETWAKEQETALARGDWIDPRLSEITVGTWYERCKDTRVLELASRKRDASHWRCHVEPYWRDWPIGAILQPDVSAWVVKMQQQERVTKGGKKVKTGADTIIGSAKVLRGLLEQAVKAKLLRFNPAKGVTLPRVSPSDARVLHPDEDAIVLGAFRRRFGSRPDGALFVEFLLDTGCRWEEAAALSRPHVDLRRQRVRIADVMERDGTIRPYAKTAAGNREVPIGAALWPKLRARVMACPPDGLVFTAPRGGPLNYSRWLSRIWTPTFTVVTERGGRNGQHIITTAPLLEGARPTPHDMRHTYGTRLADENVPQHEIRALMGHDDPRAAAGYAHAGEARFQRARDALDRARKTGGSPAAHKTGAKARKTRSEQ